MATITIRGREIPLLYTTYEMKEIQEQVAPFEKAVAMLLGRNPEDDTDTSRFGGAEHLDTIAKMIRIMGNAGLEEAGENPDLTEKKILRALRPAEIGETVNTLTNAMQEGMASEIPDKAKEGPVDVTLEEMKKKEVKGD